MSLSNFQVSYETTSWPLRDFCRGRRKILPFRRKVEADGRNAGYTKQCMENKKEDYYAAAGPTCHPRPFRHHPAIKPIRSKLGTQNSFRIPFSRLDNNGYIANLLRYARKKSFHVTN